MKIIFISIFVLVFINLYLFLVKKTDFNNFISYLINIKYKQKNKDLKSEIVYSSLNKIIEFNEEIIKEETEVIDEIVNVSKEEEEIIKERPIIYIYNTHDTEEYAEPSITDDSITPTVKTAAYILKDHLNNLDIDSIVETRKIKTYLNEHNYGYNKSYTASRHYLSTALVEKNYDVIIDLHRDSIKRNLSVYEKDNIKYAKVLFVLSKKHENYKKNEEIVKTLNNFINKEYKGLSRGIMYRTDVTFNQDLSPTLILLEVGGVDNTLEEINNTLYVIANVLNEYFNNKEVNE